MVEAGGPMPRALETKPVLPPDLLFSWEAYLDLDYERGVGFAGPETIKLRDFLLYADFNGYAKEDKLRVWRHVHYIDLEWHRLREEKRQQTKESAKTGTQK